MSFALAVLSEMHVGRPVGDGRGSGRLAKSTWARGPGVGRRQLAVKLRAQ